MAEEKMGHPCSICMHPKLEEINKLLGSVESYVVTL